MYQEHKDFTKPDDPNATIWRYMNLAKFVSLLDKRMLFFAQLGKLLESDPYEAAVPKPDREWFQEHATKLLKELLGDSTTLSFPNEMEIVGFVNRYVAVNSWCTGQHESAAMWKLYTSASEGLAITSTFARLTSSLNLTERQISAGLVTYIDYQDDSIIIRSGKRGTYNPYWFALHKRKSFEHEHELRIFTMLNPNGTPYSVNEELIKDTGVYVPIGLETLIDTVYVSPTSPAWLVNLVVSLLGKYGLDKPVVQSSLNAIPT